MDTSTIPPAMLKQAVFEIVAECRQRLLTGQVDVSQIERGVRAYCEAIAALPLEEGRSHAEDLEELMQVVTALGDELTAARDAVSKKLSALGHVQRAHVAYQKSDAIGEKKIPPRDEPES